MQLERSWSIYGGGVAKDSVIVNSQQPIERFILDLMAAMLFLQRSEQVFCTAQEAFIRQAEGKLNGVCRGVEQDQGRYSGCDEKKPCPVCEARERVLCKAKSMITDLVCTGCLNFSKCTGEWEEAVCTHGAEAAQAFSAFKSYIEPIWRS